MSTCTCYISSHLWICPWERNATNDSATLTFKRFWHHQADRCQIWSNKSKEAEYFLKCFTLNKLDLRFFFIALHNECYKELLLQYSMYQITLFSSSHQLRCQEDSWWTDRLTGGKRATWGRFESEITMGDGEIEETGGGEGSSHNEDYGERVKAQGDITHAVSWQGWPSQRKKKPALVSV